MKGTFVLNSYNQEYKGTTQLRNINLQYLTINKLVHFLLKEEYLPTEK